MSSIEVAPGHDAWRQASDSRPCQANGDAREPQEEGEVDAFASVLDQHQPSDPSSTSVVHSSATAPAPLFSPASVPSLSVPHSSPQSASIAARLAALNAMTLARPPASSPLSIEHMASHPAHSPTPAMRFPRAFVPLATPLTANPHSPLSSPREQQQPRAGVGIDAMFFRSQLRPDRLAIGSPESLIENTFRYQMAQQIELQRRQAEGNEAAASAPAIPSLAASSSARPHPTPSHNVDAATAAVSSLRSQLRQLQSSPQFQRPDSSGSPADGGASAAFRAIPLASEFDHAASRGPTMGSTLQLSHLQASPPPSSASSSQQPNGFGDDPPHHHPAESVSALHGQLNNFNEGLSAFQQALLEHRRRLEEERTEAIGHMEESVATLEASLALEETNCHSSLEAMKMYTESVLDSWTAAHSHPWETELTELELVEQRLQARVHQLEAEADAKYAARRQDFFDRGDRPVTEVLEDIRQRFLEGEHDALPLTASMSRSGTTGGLGLLMNHLPSSVRASASSASASASMQRSASVSTAAHNHRALLKLDALEKKMHHLVQQNRRALHEQSRLMDECLATSLVRGRAEVSADVETSIIQEVTAVRQALFDATGARVACDHELQTAFRYATTKLQRGLILLRR